MGRVKDELIGEWLAERDAERQAEHAARGLRDKNPPEVNDPFDYLYNTNQLHLLDQHPNLSWREVAEMAFREANALQPEPDTYTHFGADQ